MEPIWEKIPEHKREAVRASWLAREAEKQALASREPRVSSPFVPPPPSPSEARGFQSVGVYDGLGGISVLERYNPRLDRSR